MQKSSEFGSEDASPSSSHKNPISSDNCTKSRGLGGLVSKLGRRFEQFEFWKRKLVGGRMDLVFETYLAQDADFPICDSPIWLFGRSFSIHYGKDLDGKDLDELKRTVGTCIWFTYRKNFPSIGDTNLTSDRGWGCMIRAGQMVVAKALLLRHLGTDWHWDSSTRSPVYLHLISLFGDNRTAPLSLHQIAVSGSSVGKNVGSWLGPNTVAQALKKLLDSPPLSSALDIQLFIAMDSTLVKADVKRACKGTDKKGFQTLDAGPISPHSFNTPRSEGGWKPLLLVIPLRLGLSELNASYVPGFRAAFEVKQSIGIIGGRPNHALYFIGYAEDEVLFLDPHTVQPTMTVGGKIFEAEREADESYHIKKPGRMPFSAMDPSIAVCFFCKSESDFESLCSKLLDKFRTIPLPLFEIVERRTPDWLPDSPSPPSSPSSKNRSSLSPSNSFTAIGGGGGGGGLYPNLAELSSSSAGGKNSDDDEEEFEILG